MIKRFTLKIASGVKKGSVLSVPSGIEPAKNIVKLAIFSMLGDKIVSANCLDLFCGSGNLGFEALSSGAKSCTFVDRKEDSIKCVRENAKSLNFEDKSHIYQMSANKFLISPLSTKYDVVFMDPPYKHTLDNIGTKLINCISKTGVIIYLHHKNTEVNLDGLKVCKQRFYGKTGVSVLEMSEVNSLLPLTLTFDF